MQIDFIRKTDTNVNKVLFFFFFLEKATKEKSTEN